MSSNEGDNPFSLGQANVVGETDKAVWFYVDDLDRRLWVPKSVIHDNSETWDSENDDGELVVRQWWA